MGIGSSAAPASGASHSSRAHRADKLRTIGFPLRSIVFVAFLRHFGGIEAVAFLEILRAIPPGGAGLSLLVEHLGMLFQEFADEQRRIGYVILHGRLTSGLARAPGRWPLTQIKQLIAGMKLSTAGNDHRLATNQSPAIGISRAAPTCCRAQSVARARPGSHYIDQQDRDCPRI